MSAHGAGAVEAVRDPAGPGGRSRVLVLVEVLGDGDGDAVSGASLELLTVARRLGDVHALWLGAGVAGADGTAGVTGQLREYGVAVLHTVALAPGAGTLAAAASQAVVSVARTVGADTVLLPSTPHDAEVAALVGHALGAGLVLAATDVHRDPDGRVTAIRRAFRGTWRAEVAVTRPRAVLTLVAGVVRPVPAAAPARVCLRRHAAAVPWGLHGLRLVERTPRRSPSPDLTTAEVVVVGGRGTGGDFAPLRELAEVLGGAVGATGVATHEGWIGADAKIGASGISISPRLYIGAGVSGAEHHRSGMETADVIVAVNADPDAPLFEIAHFGVVGDLFTVVPQLTAELLARRSSRAGAEDLSP